MPWLQLVIHSDPLHSDGIEDRLLSLGALSITFSDCADQPILEPALGETPLWDKTAITALFDAEVECATLDQQLATAIEGYAKRHHWEIVEDKDWTREWMRNYHPIHCGGDLWICPSWLEPPEPKAVNVMLDPGLAFGTGTHPTTLMCLQWLASAEVREYIQRQTVIDYGCGSGILGIAALKLGAAKLVAVDIDSQALLATRDNAHRNGIDPQVVETYLPNQTPAKAESLVFANILAGPLVDLAPRLMDLVQTDGLLCLSGLLVSQGESVLVAYQSFCQLQSRRELEQWLQLGLRKFSSARI